MSSIIGLSVVFGSLITGYLGNGGIISILLHPFEWLIIVGCGIGAFIFSTNKSIRSYAWKGVKKLSKADAYKEDTGILLLSSISSVLKFVHKSGVVELEKHLDVPATSHLFKKLLEMPSGEEVVSFFCDYMRLLVMGFDKSHDLIDLMDRHIEKKKAELYGVYSAIAKLADAFPAIGIVAAVLGVITAMASVGADAAVLGARIASALVGTFAGVFLSYCVVAPISNFLEKFSDYEISVFESVKSAIASHADGNPPAISIEFARQVLPSSMKPSFEDLEKILQKVQI
ncbi:Motility protein A [Candidatus Cyrtobacter comes]|uniref:Motility protein A n=1 Tax=Candidatus Cyrtobacter comes TaxID=675776 RepID=A0ABU5L9B5_9RICK|nr:motility-associated protein [Candidatus Cyrtobacter comes]MDZ5762719.1 Motility protein A [Candidatus Cyrtobacter comes]